MTLKIIRGGILLGVSRNDEEYLSNALIECLATIEVQRHAAILNGQTPSSSLRAASAAADMLIVRLHHVAIGIDLLIHLGNGPQVRSSDHAEAALVFLLNAAREWFDQAGMLIDRLCEKPTGSRPSFKDLLKALKDSKRPQIHTDVATAVLGISDFFFTLRRIRTLVVHGADESNWNRAVTTIVYPLPNHESIYGFNCYDRLSPIIKTSFSEKNDVIPVRLFAGYVCANILKFMHNLGEAFRNDLSSRSNGPSQLVEGSTAGIYIPALKQFVADFQSEASDATVEFA